MFLRYPKLEIVQNVKNIMLVPFCKKECFDYYEPYEKKNVTRTARPLCIDSPLINVRVSLLSSSTGCSYSLSVSLILATCLVDLWGAINSRGRPAVGGSESTERGKECFLKKFGSRKILAWSQNLGSVCNRS